MKIDLSYVKSAKIQPAITEQIRILLIGCGGTGSWFAPSLARIAYVLREQGKTVQVRFIDGDIIEPKNIPRQNFCEAELGLNKAIALATRYASAWGIEIGYDSKMFEFNPSYLPGDANTLTVVVGCVDNAKARQEIEKLRAHGRGKVWWLDCGNTEAAGQVLLGNADQANYLTEKLCVALPSPAIQSPDLLIARPEEKSVNKLSCAELQLVNAQSLAINQVVAANATDMLLRFLNGTLTRYAMHFDLASGSMRSKYCVKEKPKRKTAQLRTL